ncbi:hypothetical protein QR78_14390 [Methylobacterium indicum]|uniref:Uncharacterized protein n=1 Tax=Methylobacterium indicum TaxID=1775910 RepID=A0ABR5HET1_9HYPH|nr:hypothetical protein QR78_14390 [Methylobacterium indicum]KMO25053.1 hypothetical protein QR79_09780 [Methylobacterium indicum]
MVVRLLLPGGFGIHEGDEVGPAHGRSHRADGMTKGGPLRGLSTWVVGFRAARFTAMTADQMAKAMQAPNVMQRATAANRRGMGNWPLSTE